MSSSYFDILPDSIRIFNATAEESLDNEEANGVKHLDWCEEATQTLEKYMKRCRDDEEDHGLKLTAREWRETLQMLQQVEELDLAFKKQVDGRDKLRRKCCGVKDMVEAYLEKVQGMLERESSSAKNTEARGKMPWMIKSSGRYLGEIRGGKVGAVGGFVHRR